MQFHGSSKKEKERALARVRTRGGVLMTTYGLVVTTKETFAERHGQQFVWVSHGAVCLLLVCR